MKKQLGFTLIEVIIAIGIFAILGFGCYKVVNGMAVARETVKNKAEQLRIFSRAMHTIDADFHQISPRRILDESGKELGAFISSRDDYLVEFSRHGVRNPLMLKRAEVIRVAYQYHDELNTDDFDENPDELLGDGRQGYLVRYVWPVLDRASESKPEKKILLAGVKSFTLEYLNKDKTWDEDWPPAGSQQNASLLLEIPYAVHLKIDTNSYGMLERYFQVREIPQP